MFGYVATAQRATAVTHALTCSFTGGGEVPAAPLNLVVVKAARLEVYRFDEAAADPASALNLLLDVPLYGRVATLRAFRPAGERADLLFVTTERFDFFVLAFDPESRELVTRAHGDVRDRSGMVNDYGHFGVVDPQCRLVGVHAYHGVLKVIPMDTRGHLRDMFNVHLEELRVIDMVLLHGCAMPTLAVLHEDHHDARHVDTHTIAVRDRTLQPGPWCQKNVEPGACMLLAVPQPYGGVLIVGEQSVTYHAGRYFKSTPLNCTRVCAAGQLDECGTRWLLGDQFGQLQVLVLHCDPDRHTVDQVQLEALGTTSVPESLCYLDQGLVFVGSKFGDQQLVRLLDHAPPSGSGLVEVLASWPCLGPIVDFVVVDTDQQGQGQVVSCSGAGKDGSLRIVRNGVGIKEQADVELPGIKGLWSLRPNSSEQFDRYLVQSYIGETRVLGIDLEGELGEIEIPGFVDAQTICCGNVAADLIVQVTPNAVTTIDANTLHGLGTWSAPSTITVACIPSPAEGVEVPSFVAVALAGGRLVLFQVDSATRRLVVVGDTTLPHEISCLDLEPLWPLTAAESATATTTASDAMDTTEDSPGAADTEGPNALPCPWLLAVGTWTDFYVRLLTLPTLQEVDQRALGTDTQARSVLLASFPDFHALLVGLGDGSLLSLALEFSPGVTALAEPPPSSPTPPPTAARLGAAKKVALGAQPLLLRPFTHDGARCAFACCDRPTVLFGGSNGKLAYANVNANDIYHLAPFHAELFPGCLALASEQRLMIGTIDDIQKLQIRTVPLRQQPRRIAHLPTHRALAVCCIRFDNTVVAPSGGGDLGGGGGSSGELEEQHVVRFLDDGTLDDLTSFALEPTEQALSATACTFADDPTEFLVVGTAFATTDPGQDFEPTSGRVLVFALVDAAATDADGLDLDGHSVAARRATLVAEVETAGAVYDLCAFNGRLLAGVNARVELFVWTASEHGVGSLSLQCAHQGHILALHLRSRGDLVLVGDLMRSVCLLLYRSAQGTLEEVARDFSANWMTAVAMIDDEVFLGAEHANNLFTVRRNPDATTDEERARLEPWGEYHLGDFVNRFRRGSLVPTPVTSAAADAAVDDAVPMEDALAADGSSGSSALLSAASKPPLPPAASHSQPLLFATVGGAIGSVLQLTEQQFCFLASVSRAMAQVVVGVGGLTHGGWRAFENERKVAEARNFLDGDHIESFLDLKPADQKRVVDLMIRDDPAVLPPPPPSADAPADQDAAAPGPLSVDEVVKRIEEVARLH